MNTVQIFDRRQMLREIAQTRTARSAYGYDDDQTDVIDQTDDPDLSSGESSRARVLKEFYRDPRGEIRPSLHGTAQMADSVLEIAAIAPHFNHVLGIYVRAIHLSMLTQAPLSVPPVLLLGGPGLGKTYVASRLADALGTSMARLAMNSISDTNLLLGHPSTWRGAKVGLLTRALVECETASPLYFMDEIDKLSSWPYDGHSSYAPILSVLETENAKACRDEYLCVDFDLSHAIVVATANEIDHLHPAIRDRFLAIEIDQPDARQLLIVTKSIYHAVAGRYCGEVKMPPDDALAELTRLNPRSVGRIIALALGFAAEDKRRTLARRDIARAIALLPKAGAGKTEAGHDRG